MNPPSAPRTAAALLRQLSVLDAEAARRFLEERVPERLRLEVSKEAGLESPAN